MTHDKTYDAGAMVRELRKRGLTISQISVGTNGISPSTISHYLAGKRCGRVYYNALQALLKKTKKKGA